MMGIIEEGTEFMGKEAPESVMDAGLIASAQEVEHYEICSYGTLKSWADQLGMNDEARQLEQSLREEEEADQRLSKLATTVNAQAMEGVEEDSEEGESVPAPARRGNGTGGSRGSRKR